jgi:hypothetical protein
MSGFHPSQTSSASTPGAIPKWKRRATLGGWRAAMGVSFHQVGRRFEGRESATINRP